MCPRSPYAKDKKPKDEQDRPVACRSILDSGKHKLQKSKSKLSDSGQNEIHTCYIPIGIQLQLQIISG